MRPPPLRVAWLALSIHLCARLGTESTMCGNLGVAATTASATAAPIWNDARTNHQVSGRAPPTHTLHSSSRPHCSPAASPLHAPASSSLLLHRSPSMAPKADSKNAGSNDALMAASSVNTTSVVQIIETEVRLNQKWTSPPPTDVDDDKSESDSPNLKSANSGRTFHWMDATTLEPVDSPFTYPLGPNQSWVGDWKILVPQRTSSQAASASTPSSHGWHYSRIDESDQDGNEREEESPKNAGSAAADSVLTVSRKRQSRSGGPLLQYTHRRRVWVRTVATTVSSATATTSEAQKAKTLKQSVNLSSKPTSKRRRKRKNPIQQVTQAIRDDWNFKGVGFTFAKSMVFPNAYGFTFRLPLTLNFATWERHPSWPSIGTSMAIFYSGAPPPSANTRSPTTIASSVLSCWTVAVFLHVSLRMEYIKAIAQYINSIAVPTIVAGLIRILLNGWIVAVSAILYPITRRMPLVVVSPPPPLDSTSNAAAAPGAVDASLFEWSRLWTWPEPPRNRRDSEERLSISWSWRWTPMQSYEFRTVYAHYFAVQIATVWEALVTPWLSALLSAVSKQSVTATAPNWISRHAAAIGWSMAGPLNTKDTGGILVTATTLASLSGFYLPIASLFPVLFRTPQSISTTAPTPVANATSTLLLEDGNRTQSVDGGGNPSQEPLTRSNPLKLPKPSTANGKKAAVAS